MSLESRRDPHGGPLKAGEACPPSPTHRQATSDVSRSPAPLTDKMKRFVDEYVGPSRFNATQAAIAAGYSEKSASEIGYENLRKPQIRDAACRAASVSRASISVLRLFDVSAGPKLHRSAG